jgi:teichuronic acid biosynthesis glycosyltransferase TuaC
MSALHSSLALLVSPNWGSSYGATTPLRVLTLTPFYPSIEDPTQGGFVAEPLSQMEHLGITSEVIAAQPFYRGHAHPLNSQIASTWKQYLSFPGNLGLPMAGKFLAAGLMRTILKWHRTRPFDLIHAHAALPCGQTAALLSSRLGLPFVVTVHGLDAFSTRQAGSTVGEWCRRASERVFRSARCVICISEKVRERIAHVSANAVVVYNGVDEEMFSPGAESLPVPIVLSVGNLIPTKGHALLLRALARVSSAWSLEIIGDGPEHEKLVAMAHDLRIAERVRFLGRQRRETVATAMRRCAVFALPSSYEGLGCVYLEAMSSAKPAIGCHGQGIDEIIQHGTNGWLISPANEMELSGVLRELLEDQDLRKRVGAIARATILQRHTLRHQSRQLAEIYREFAS